MALIGHTKHQTVGAQTSNSASYTGTSGNGLIVLVNMTTNPTTVSVSDTLGNTWTNPFALARFSTANDWLAVFYCQTLNSSSANTITASCGAAVVSEIFVAEYSGLGAFDAVSVINGNFSSTPSTNSATPTQTGDLGIMFVGTDGSSRTFSSWGGGFTQQDTGSFCCGWADQTIAGTSPVTGSAVLSGTANWSAIVLLFKPAAGPSYTFVQDSANCSSAAVSTLSTSAITVTAGNFLLAVAYGNGQSVSAITDGPGDTFTLIGVSATGKLQVYCCPNALGGSTSATFTFGGATNVQVYLAEYSGLGQSFGAVLGWSAAKSNVDTALTGGPVNVSSVPAMLWAMCLDESSDATAPVVSGSLTGRTSAVWACNTPFALNGMGDELVSSAGNTSSTFTTGSGFDSIQIVTAAIALASSTPSSPPLTQLMNRRIQLYFS